MTAERLDMPHRSNSVLFRGSGDREAFATFYQEQEGNVRGFLRFKGVPESRPWKILTQEVFARTWQARDRFRAESRIQTFLFAIAINVQREHSRSAVRANTANQAQAFAQRFQRDHGCEHPLSADIEMAKAQLSPADRTLIEWAYHWGLKPRDIAVKLRCSRDAARQRLCAARKRIRLMLERRIGERQSRNYLFIWMVVLTLAVPCAKTSRAGAGTLQPPQGKFDQTDFSAVDSIQNVLRHFAKPYDPVAIVTAPELVGRNLQTSGIERLAETYGLFCRRWDRLRYEQLATLTGPVILHVRGSRFSVRPDRFVVYEGAQGESATLINGSEHILMPSALLQTRWNGDALELSALPGC